MIKEITQTQTTYQVAARFDELAQQEKWFEIQDELFANNVRSVEPNNSPYLNNVEGKEAVRQKGKDWVARIEQVHKLHTSKPVVCGNHFAVGRSFDITVKGLGNVRIDELMVYEVQDGQITAEQFFY